MSWINSRDNRQITGKLCEAITIASFIGDGFQVALPFGNQAKWDLLVNRNDGAGWLTVQVKAARKYRGFIQTSVCIGSPPRKITKEDVDLVVAVYPEDGRLWILGPEVFTTRVNISVESLQVKDQLMIESSKIDKRITPSAAYISRRRRASFKINAVKPDKVSDENWDIYLRFVGGETYRAIAGEMGLDTTSIRDRVERVLRNLGDHTVLNTAVSESNS